MSVRSSEKAEQREKCPTLEVFDLQPTVERDLASHAAQPVTEFDVFHRRLRVSLCVKPADGFEGFAAHRPAPGPEGCGLGRCTLMHEVMLQVLVLRDEVRLGGRVVVRAEHRCDVGSRAEECDSATECVALHDDIRIDEEEDAAARVPRSSIACRRRPALLCQLNNFDSAREPPSRSRPSKRHPRL